MSDFHDFHVFSLVSLVLTVRKMLSWASLRPGNLSQVMCYKKKIKSCEKSFFFIFFFGFKNENLENFRFFSQFFKISNFQNLRFWDFRTFRKSHVFFWKISKFPIEKCSTVFFFSTDFFLKTHLFSNICSQKTFPTIPRPLASLLVPGNMNCHSEFPSDPASSVANPHTMHAQQSRMCREGSPRIRLSRCQNREILDLENIVKKKTCRVARTLLFNVNTMFLY